MLNVYKVWPKEKRKKLAELISSTEDCKQAGLEGGVHAMHLIWETHKMEEGRMKIPSF